MAITRRAFLSACAAAAVAPAAEVVIDIHQHTNYSGRPDDVLVAHQRALGVTRTVLLPAGSRFGLAADAFGNDSVVEVVRRFPGEFTFFANELPDIPETRAVLERYLKMGAIGIGEQKFPVDCDSKAMDLVARIAAEYGVPVLMHFEHGAYNTSFDRFHTMLERHPKVNFIGHAQTWWGNIDRDHDQTILYPKTPVTPGGLTDRYLRDYPNMFGDLSAGSGLNSMLRDEEHARAFLKRHQDKLLFGTDCNDRVGAGAACQGAGTLSAIRRLAEPAVIAKILSGNARRIMRLDRSA